MIFISENTQKGDIIVLKNCPFCGSAPKTYSEHKIIGHGEGIKDFVIRCPKCGVVGPSIKKAYYDATEEIVREKVKLWNTRV